MSCTEAYFNNDHELTVTNLETAGSSLGDATITYQIYDSENEAVSGASGTLINVGTSNDYSATVDKTIINLLSSGEEYTIRITGSDSGYDFEFNIPIVAKRRGSS